MATIPKGDMQKRHDEERAKYMAGDLSHHEFYCWLSDAIGLTDGMIPASAAEVKASTDKHLNDIALMRWDDCDDAVRGMAVRAGMRSWSLSDTVCCLKAMAKRRRERDAEDDSRAANQD